MPNDGPLWSGGEALLAGNGSGVVHTRAFDP
jgi:hypothetical protein